MEATTMSQDVPYLWGNNNEPGCAIFMGEQQWTRICHIYWGTTMNQDLPYLLGEGVIMSVGFFLVQNKTMTMGHYLSLLSCIAHTSCMPVHYCKIQLNSWWYDWLCYRVVLQHLGMAKATPQEGEMQRKHTVSKYYWPIENLTKIYHMIISQVFNRMLCWTFWFSG